MAFNKKINPYLSLLIIFLVGLVFTLFILASLSQPVGIKIDREAAVAEE